MNADFHYHATHLAALYAGFSRENAVKIAKAAQLVDDLTLDLLDETKMRDTSKPVDRQTVTCMSMLELGGYFVQQVPWTARQQERFREVWMAFHFLPGNLDYTCLYEGPNELDSMKWKLTAEDIKLFRYLCLPCSSFVGTMINDLSRWKQSPFFLHMLGIRLHVLADTWAHSGFLGFPRMHANDIVKDSGMYVEYEGEWKQATVSGNQYVITEDNLGALRFATTPMAITPANQLWMGISYLGHGRIGSLADYGCLKFKYSPFYKSDSEAPQQVRDNRAAFSNAFHQMVYAMECVQTGDTFYPNTIPSTHSSKILPVLQTWKLDQSEEWDTLCQKTFGHRPPAYGEKEWMKKDSTDYGHYKKAAEQHLQLFNETFQF